MSMFDTIFGQNPGAMNMQPGNMGAMPLQPPMQGAMPMPQPQPAPVASEPQNPMANMGQRLRGNLGPLLQGLGMALASNNPGMGAQYMAQMGQQRQEMAQKAKQGNATLAYLKQAAQSDPAAAQYVQMAEMGAISPADAFAEYRKIKIEAQRPKERKTYEDAFGIHRYMDNGEPVNTLEARNSGGMMPGNGMQQQAQNQPTQSGQVPNFPNTPQGAALRKQFLEEQENAAKKERRAASAKAQAHNVLRAIGDAENTISDARGEIFGTGVKIPGLFDNNRSLGITGKLYSFIPGTHASNLAASMDTIRANLGFDKLQEIRDNSPTGGALGPVSDFENRLMQSTVASLSTAQSPEQLQRNLGVIKRLYTDIALGRSTMESLQAYEAELRQNGVNTEQPAGSGELFFDTKTGKIGPAKGS